MAPATPLHTVSLVMCSHAGTACAWSLARHPKKFEVHVWEALPVPGGVASSCTVKDGVCALHGRRDSSHLSQYELSVVSPAASHLLLAHSLCQRLETLAVAETCTP